MHVYTYTQICKSAIQPIRVIFLPWMSEVHTSVQCASTLNIRYMQNANVVLVLAVYEWRLSGNCFHVL